MIVVQFLSKFVLIFKKLVQFNHF